MTRLLQLLAVVLAALGLLACWARDDRSDGRDAGASTTPPSFLPPEADAVLAAIARGGPHPHRQDGGVFQNREKELPQRTRGWYREYTVATPGARDRGPRRIVTGGDPPREYFYTADHYRTFRRFDPPRGEVQR